jgi:hypothetical protein
MMRWVIGASGSTTFGMSDLPPDRRGRIGWRWPLAIIVVTLGLLARGAVYYHRTITPPDCTDPRTLALVHDSLTGHFKLPDTTSLQGIHTIAGGYLAFRYVCGAQLTGFDPHALPPGAMIPSTVRYVSHLTDEGRRHEVTVRVAPLMILVQVE